VTSACRGQVMEFFVKLFHSGINTSSSSLVRAEPVEGFRAACMEDILTMCRSRPDVLVMGCLKAKKSQLSSDCKEKVFAVQINQAQNYSLDAPLFIACKADITGLKGCQTSVPGGRLACLKGHRTSVSDACKQELFRREQQDSEDIRLNQDVLSTCKAEIQTSCKYLEFGEARMLKCLWDASTKRTTLTASFSQRCREKVYNLTMHSVSDYRLDFRVRTRCDQDINELCIKEREAVDRLSIADLFGRDGQQGFFSEAQSGQVLRCLKSNYLKVKNTMCREAVMQVISIQAAHAAADPVLMRACNWDLSTHCQGSKPGEIHACLRKKMNELSLECREEELLQGALEASDITLKPRLFYTCKHAMGTFCNDISPGGAKMYQCLQDNRLKTDFPLECKKAIVKDLEASNNDWRLKFGISENCKPEMERMCKHPMQQGGGKALKCLKKHYLNVTVEGCKRALTRYVRQGTENIKLAPAVFDQCQVDVERYCQDVQPGSGRVHDCLYKHKRNISEECAKAEFHNEMLQMHDFGVSSGLVRHCKGLRQKLCPDIPMQGSQLLTCMQDHMNDEAMTTDCKHELTKHMGRQHADFFLNPLVKKFCNETARQICPSEFKKAQLRDLTSNGELLTCIMKKRSLINNTNCKNALLKKEHQRVSDILLAPATTNLCRSDIQKFCSSVRSRGMGETRKCLAAHMKNLTDGCSKTVMDYTEMASEDVRFKAKLYNLCKAASKSFCPDIKVGGGRMMNCLLDHMHNSEMHSHCRDELVEEQTWRSKNIRFNPILKTSCKSDIMKLLGEQKCGNPSVEGWKINCLTKHRSELTAPACKTAVTGILKRQSADYRAVPGMERSCKKDVERLCNTTGLGRGKIHACLREQEQKITDPVCKKMVNRTHEVDKQSATINYNVRKNCYNERQAFCKDAPSGQMVLLGCLAANMNETHFSDACREALAKTNFKKALIKAPTLSVAHLKDVLRENRGLIEKYGPILLGGWVAFVILAGLVISYFVIKRKRLFTIYGSVAPRDQPEDLER